MTLERYVQASRDDAKEPNPQSQPATRRSNATGKITQ
jgi:hypothetical protein